MNYRRKGRREPNNWLLSTQWGWKKNFKFDDILKREFKNKKKKLIEELNI